MQRNDIPLGKSCLGSRGVCVELRMLLIDNWFFRASNPSNCSSGVSGCDAAESKLPSGLEGFVAPIMAALFAIKPSFTNIEPMLLLLVVGAELASWPIWLLTLCNGFNGFGLNGFEFEGFEFFCFFGF